MNFHQAGVDRDDDDSPCPLLAPTFRWRQLSEHLDEGEDSNRPRLMPVMVASIGRLDRKGQ